MKRYLFIISLLFSGSVFAQHKTIAPKTFDLLIGTYTTGNSKGIYVYRFYTETGKLAYLNEIDGVANPSYLCVSNNNKYVYAVNETGKQGEVSSFSFEPNSGKIQFLNKQPSGGADPCYVSVDKDQKNIFVANYSSGSLAVLPVNKDGSLNPASQIIQDEGKGPNKDRQEKAHVHTAMLSPDEKYLFSADLGTDKLNIYHYHSSQKQPLEPATPPFMSVVPGNGPRHIDFSPDHKFLYMVQEMGSAVNAYSYNKGKLTRIQTINMLPSGFNGQAGAAAIHITPDGKFLYATNRLDASEIVVFSRNQQTGELTLVEHHATYGKNPRDFAIDPTGTYLLVANQNSDSIYEFKINKDTGTLSTTGVKLEVGNPVCLKFVAAE